MQTLSLLQPYARPDLDVTSAGRQIHRLVPIPVRPTRLGEWTSVGDVLSDVMKEISRRVELRQGIESERGTTVTDAAFLRLAEESGGLRL